MIEVIGLTKRYGSHLAIDNLNFTISDGEIVGFLGPNGAGKTTAMSIMAGYLSPTEGTAVINGHDIIESPLEAKAQIGYLPDTPPVYPNMTVWEYLNFVADIKKVKKAGRAAHLLEIMEAVKITDMKGRIIRNLSKGYRQRVGLCQAMVGSPDVIILDEPTVGLDPKQIIEMRSVIKELGQKHTVMLSSHILSEVSAVCDRIMIINKGKIVASDTPDKLSSAVAGQNRILIRVRGNYEDAAAVFSPLSFVKNIENAGQKEEGTADIVLIGEDGADIRPDAYNACVLNNVQLLGMKNMDLTLEEIFLEITAASERIDTSAEDFGDADFEAEGSDAGYKIDSEMENILEDESEEGGDVNDGNN